MGDQVLVALRAYAGNLRALLAAEVGDGARVVCAVRAPHRPFLGLGAADGLCVTGAWV